MSTTIEKKNKDHVKHDKKTKTVKENQFQSEGELKIITIHLIDFSPFNYRKAFSEDALQNFAVELKLHGIISPLLVRPKEDGRYELVAGERRLKAAKIAGLQVVPATVKKLTDEEVTEIQLSENLQREDPHPLDEAQAIGLMMKAHKKIEDIAARLGKSKGFVYSRMKLLCLTEPFAEMFLANIIVLKEAFEIAMLSEQSQNDLFENHCRNWKKEKNFRLHNLSYLLSQYRYDLNRAPFETKDKTLVPKMGACAGCPFNSAGLKTLFPDFAKEAVCSNSSCYQTKCTAHFTITLTKAFAETQPNALLVQGSPSEEILAALETIPGAKELPLYNRYDVCRVQPPEMPDIEDYVEQEEEGVEPILDEEGYNLALLEYHADQEDFQRLIQDGKVQKSLVLSHGSLEVIDFTLDQNTAKASGQKVTAKQVQEAIKTKSASPELLQAEIERITGREKRLKELDEEKVQSTIHEAFTLQVKEVQNNQPSPADLTAIRLIVYQSLDYSTRATVNAVLFPEGFESRELVHSLAELPDKEFSYLIRMAVSSKPESKYVGQPMAICLRKVAEGAGIDTATIEIEQTQKALERNEKQQSRIKELQRLIEQLKSKA